MRKIIQILSLPLRNDPWIRCHVGNGVLVADNKFSPGEALIQHRIQARRFFHVTLDCIRQFFRRVMVEVMVLPQHRPQTAHLPHQPFERFDLAAQIFWNEFTGLAGKI